METLGSASSTMSTSSGDEARLEEAEEQYTCDSDDSDGEGRLATASHDSESGIGRVPIGGDGVRPGVLLRPVSRQLIHSFRFSTLAGLAWTHCPRQSHNRSLRH